MENAVAEKMLAKVADSGGAMVTLDDNTRMILWIGIGLYVALMIFIGYWASLRVKTVGDFIVAGRRLPLWMATATLLATWFGAGSSMGVAATVYSGGLRDVLADPFAASLSLILAGIFIVGVLRKLKCMTVTDIIQQRYGIGAGIYASLWMIPVYVGWLGAQVLGLGTLLNLLTGVDMLQAQLIGAAVVLLYTVTGGMWAVTVTDVVQVALIVIGLFIIVPGAVHYAGGWEAIAKVPELDLSLLPSAAERARPGGWVNYMGNWMIMGLGCMVGQDLIQRALASRTEKIAISSSVMAGVFYLAIAMVPITIGLAAKVLLPKWGITDAMMQVDGGGALENQVLPRVAVGVLGAIHPILLTLFLSALISAIMSSADSSLLAASSLLVNNVVLPLAPKTPERNRLLLTRIATVVLIALATFLAMKVQSIYVLMKNCWASQLVVVFTPVVAAIYFRKASRHCAWSAMLAGTAVWLVYMFVAGLGMGGTLTEALASADFDFELTNGAVYAFGAAVAAFFAAYAGERIVKRAGNFRPRKKHRRKQEAEDDEA